MAEVVSYAPLLIKGIFELEYRAGSGSFSGFLCPHDSLDCDQWVPEVAGLFFQNGQPWITIRASGRRGWHQYPRTTALSRAAPITVYSSVLNEM